MAQSLLKGVQTFRFHHWNLIHKPLGACTLRVRKRLSGGKSGAVSEDKGTAAIVMGSLEGTLEGRLFGLEPKSER